jgi:ribonuclease HI
VPTSSLTLVANIDGGARGNPGEAGFGVYVQDELGREVASLYGYLGHQTNNVAEYAALLAALRYGAGRGVARLKIRSDSELLVRQINGQYRVKNPVLRRLHQAAQSLMGRCGQVTVEHVRREQNHQADRLANEAMDTKQEDPPGIATGLLEV